MRLDYPPNVHIIRLPCTGKVDVAHLLKAFLKGADGVYVVGCLEGACHYNDGNLKARQRVEQVKIKLEELGLESERVRMYNLSSGEGPAFAAFAREMTDLVRSLGPTPLRSPGDDRQTAAHPS